MSITVLVGIWLILCAIMLRIGVSERRFSAGMPLAYFLGLSLIHVPGAMVYINTPQWVGIADRTRIGFEQTIIGMVAFLAGVILARSYVFTSRQYVEGHALPANELSGLDRLALLYLVGGICYFMLGTFISIPSVGAIIAALSSLLIVGASLRLWVAIQEHRPLKLGLTLGLLPLMPAITMVKDGFIGFGTYWLLSCLGFAIAQTRRRVGIFFLAPLVIFMGVSLFVNYMVSRTEFRQAVWFQQVGFADRFERVMNMFRNFEWLDTDNRKHLEVIDGRLNQNIIVGAAVERLQSGRVNYALGSTISDMAIGLIPRALWPDKPQVGGGGAVVRDYAGMKFAEGTSVGAGQVLEFYINFGLWGVIGGFLIYGWFIGWMDIRIIECLREADQNKFLLWFLVCLALLQPGGNLLEIGASAAGSAITAYAFGHALRIWRKQAKNRTPAEFRPI